MRVQGVCVQNVLAALVPLENPWSFQEAICGSALRGSSFAPAVVDDPLMDGLLYILHTQRRATFGIKPHHPFRTQRSKENRHHKTGMPASMYTTLHTRWVSATVFQTCVTRQDKDSTR